MAGRRFKKRQMCATASVRSLHALQTRAPSDFRKARTRSQRLLAGLADLTRLHLRNLVERNSVGRNLQGAVVGHGAQQQLQLTHKGTEVGCSGSSQPH